mgnify:CR=1 FL=1
MGERISAEERQFSLILALIASPAGLKKRDILATVNGYSQDAKNGVPVENLERRFERDKVDLRELGIPVDVFDDPAHPGDNRESRYRITEGSFALDEGITFDADETALLEAAAGVWARGSLSLESQRGLAKLRSRGVSTANQHIGVAPRLRSREAAFEPLAAAIERGRIVEFSYRKPGSNSTERRRLAPHALVQAGGRWMVGGHDLDREADRRFLLSRIEGSVRDVGPAPSHLRTSEDAASRHRAELDRLAESQRATVALRPGSDAAVRLSRRGRAPAERSAVASWPTVEIPYVDIEVLADELAGFGPEVRAIAPAELAERIAQRHRQTIDTHAARVADDDSGRER